MTDPRVLSNRSQLWCPGLLVLPEYQIKLLFFDLAVRCYPFLDIVVQNLVANYVLELKVFP